MSITESLKTQTATWFVGVVVALLSIFSSKIVESAKFALNRAELRTKNYEELSTDLSEFVFLAELTAEYLDHGWTTREALTPLIKDYNDSITKLRRKEYVYISWITRYWDRDLLKCYTDVFDLIRKFDKAIHSVNDEFEAVNIRKTQEKVTPERATAAAKEMNAILLDLRSNTNALLTQLL
jgi:hypothetical protein